MKFKGNIYITDPSYIAKSEDWMEGFNPLVESIDFPEFSASIIRSTGIGDGCWMVYAPESISSPAFYSICVLINKGDSIFRGVDKSIPLYIPAESIDLYQSAPRWSEFTSIHAIK